MSDLKVQRVHRYTISIILFKMPHTRSHIAKGTRLSSAHHLGPHKTLGGLPEKEKIFHLLGFLKLLEGGHIPPLLGCLPQKGLCRA